MAIAVALEFTATVSDAEVTFKSEITHLLRCLRVAANAADEIYGERVTSRRTPSTCCSEFVVTGTRGAEKEKSA